MLQSGGKRVRGPLNHTNVPLSNKLVNVWTCFISYLCFGLGRNFDTRNDNRPLISITINGKSVSSLFDSGSQISLLNWDTFVGLQNRPRLSRAPITLNTANGGTIDVMGSGTFSMTVGPVQTQYDLIVVKGMNAKCILGQDFMLNYGIVLDAGERKIMVKGKPRKNLTVAASQAYTLEPHTESLVRAQPPMTLAPTNYICSSIYGFEEENSPLHVDQGLVTPAADNSIPVVISNASDFPIKINRGQIIAKIEPIASAALQHATPVSLPPFSQKRRKLVEEDVNLQGIPNELRSRYLRLLSEFSDIFSLSPDEIGKCPVLPQRITLKDPSKIASRPPYPVPHHLLPVVTDYVDKLLRSGVIRRSESPFSSPLLLIRKPNAEAKGQNIMEQYRVCHDFRLLNQNITVNKYPLRGLHQLIDSVASKKIFSVIDLSNGFFNQLLEPESQDYTAFSVQGLGQFCYTRSAQGLVNSSAAFQRMLDYVIQGLSNTYAYIDDVIIASDSHEEHLKALRDLFLRFRKYNLKCRPNKLQLGTGEVNFLGFNISQQHGIRPGAAKIKAVQDWQPPQTLTAVKQFIGLTSFFRKCIENFAQKASPLTRLTRSDSTWKSGPLPPDALHAFLLLKRLLTSRPCLAPVDFQRQFIVTVDTASNTGFGAILSQIDKSGVERPNAFASRVLNDAEKGSPAFLAESRGIVWACQTFRPYLLGNEFLIRTDHRPLISLNKVQGNTLSRLQAEMQEFLPYKIEYFPGKQMPADGLSRAALAPERVSSDRQIDATSTDAILPGISWDQIYQLQTQDSFCKAVACYLKYEKLPMAAPLLAFVNKLRSHAIMVQGVVCINSSHPELRANELKDRPLILAPNTLRHTILNLCHDSPTAGHYSAMKTTSKVLESWFWPGCKQDIKQYCQQCLTCAATNNPHCKKPVPLRKMLDPPSNFGQRVHMDLIGPLPTSINGNKYILTMVDAYSKLVEVMPIKDKTAQSAADGMIKGWISRHAIPILILTDAGNEFRNRVTQAMCDKLGMQHRTTSHYHPQANGQAEVVNRSIIAYLRKYIEGSDNWEPLLHHFALAHNTSIHSSTGHTPFFVAYGRRPIMPHSLMQPPKRPNYSEDDIDQAMNTMHTTQAQMMKHNEKAFLASKQQFDKRAQDKKFKVGDRVYVMRSTIKGQFCKFQHLYRGPYIVLRVLTNDNYELHEETTGKKITLHANRIKAVKYQQQIWTDPKNEVDPEVDPANSQPTNVRTNVKQGGTAAARTRCDPLALEEDETTTSRQGKRRNAGDEDETEPRQVKRRKPVIPPSSRVTRSMARAENQLDTSNIPLPVTPTEEACAPVIDPADLFLSCEESSNDEDINSDHPLSSHSVSLRLSAHQGSSHSSRQTDTHRVSDHYSHFWPCVGKIRK